ncbi:MAG: BolA/IbaG family iron-sulfur metabolism protein [Deltaproteobacteria bacterium]|nr:BolA/IbaG family iron-sulfur metabolism protein [Deltaproteobacteria bacterium]
MVSLEWANLSSEEKFGKDTFAKIVFFWQAPPMTVSQQVEEKIRQAFDPLHLEVINESAMHNVPKGSESHFKLIIISEKFLGKSLLERHRLVNETLSTLLKEKIHALSMQTFTSEEWNKKEGKTLASPPCSKKV